MEEIVDTDDLYSYIEEELSDLDTPIIRKRTLYSNDEDSSTTKSITH
jgi:hypothetical protein